MRSGTAKPRRRPERGRLARVFFRPFKTRNWRAACAPFPAVLKYEAANASHVVAYIAAQPATADGFLEAVPGMHPAHPVAGFGDFLPCHH